MIEAASEYTPDLDKVWMLRHSGQVRDAKEYLVESAMDLGYPLHGTSDEKLSTSAELFLLDISFLRSELNCEEAISKYESLKSKVTSFNKNTQAIYWLQLGLSYLASGVYTKALDCFSKPNTKSCDDVTKVLLQLNAIICLEGLGYDYEVRLEKVEADLKTINTTLPSSVYEQIQAIKIRHAFFVKCDFKKLDHFQSQSLTDQSKYFLFWIAKHPLLRLELNNCNLENDLIDLGGHWLRSYRMRTLQGISSEEDLTSDVRLEALIERLHLWVWFWLIDPNHFEVKKISSTLEKIASSDLTKEITPHSYKMLQNSLGWLELFQFFPLGHYNYLFSNIKKVHNDPSKIFVLEEMWIKYLYSLRLGDKSLEKNYLEEIKKSEKGIAGITILDHSSMSKKMSFLGILSQKLKAPAKNTLKNGIILDAATNDITLVKNDQEQSKLNSYSLSRLLQLFSKEKLQSKVGLFRHCFDFSYDFSIEHEQKLRNLINRANRLLGDLGKIKTSNRDYLVLDSNDQFIEVFRYIEHSQKLSNFPVIKVKKKNIHNDVNIEDFKDKWLSRGELEEISGMTKSTLSRKLSQLINDKLVLKSGTGKKTVYQVLGSQQEFLNWLKVK